MCVHICMCVYNLSSLTENTHGRLHLLLCFTYITNNIQVHIFFVLNIDGCNQLKNEKVVLLLSSFSLFTGQSVPFQSGSHFVQQRIVYLHDTPYMNKFSWCH